MMRAIIEALGVFFASAPMSDTKRTIRTRQIAFVAVNALLVAGAYAVLKG